MASELGKSERQIRRDLTALESLGLIRCRHRDRRKSNTYQFLLHTIFESSSVPGEPAGKCPVDRTSTAGQTTFASHLSGHSRPVKVSAQSANVRSRPDNSNNLTGQICPPNSVQELYTGENSSSSSSAVTDVCNRKTNDDEDDCPSSQKIEVVDPCPAHSVEDLQRFAEALRASTPLSFGVTTKIGIPIQKFPEISSCRELPSRDFTLTCLAKAPGWTVDQVLRALVINFQESPGRPKSYNWFLTTVADIYRRRNGIPPPLPVQSNHDQPTQTKLNREPTRRERFQEHILSERFSSTDRWHLQTAYRRASNSEREQILNLLDCGRSSEAIDLAIRIVDSHDEPQQQRPGPTRQNEFY